MGGRGAVYRAGEYVWCDTEGDMNGYVLVGGVRMGRRRWRFDQVVDNGAVSDGIKHKEFKRLG